MTDCDLCGVALPTLNNVKIFVPKDDSSSFGSSSACKSPGNSIIRPRFISHSPMGIWAGICDTCLESLNKTAEKVLSESEKPTGTCGKCEMCAAYTMLFGVDIEIPSFSKGSEPETSYICAVCLQACKDVFDKKEPGDSGHH